MKIDSIKGGLHHYDRGYPACGWNARLQMDVHGRCLACEQALQKQATQTTGDAFQNAVAQHYCDCMDGGKRVEAE